MKLVLVLNFYICNAVWMELTLHAHRQSYDLNSSVEAEPSIKCRKIIETNLTPVHSAHNTVTKKFTKPPNPRTTRPSDF